MQAKAGCPAVQSCYNKLEPRDKHKCFCVGASLILQAHAANTSKNFKHVYDRDNIGSDSNMENKYYIDLVYYVNLLIQTGG